MNRFNCLHEARRFNGNSDSKNNEYPDFDTKANEIMKNNNKSLTRKLFDEKRKRIFENLLTKAQEIPSIGPNDKQTVSNITAKPKTYIRQTARSETNNYKTKFSDKMKFNEANKV